MANNQYLWIRIVLFVLTITLAILRLVFFDIANERMDNTFLLLLASAVIILVLPWDRLRSFSFGGVELSLEQPNVIGALEGLALDHVEDERLRVSLLHLTGEIKRAKGGRVLWIDDRPDTILGERRLLRALGVEVVSADSSSVAEEMLRRDNDFDLIISDVQRKGESYRLNNGEPIHEGVNFIVKLRNEKHTKDPIIRSLPVIFYAAYSWDRLAEFTRPAREATPEAEITNNVETLIPKVVKSISQIRSNPLKVSGKKQPTYPS